MQGHGLFKRERACCINFSVPEVKILILLSYFVILGIISLVNFSVSINKVVPVLDDLLRYFSCQLGGYNPMCEDIRRQLEKHLNPGLNGATYFLIGLITWVYLLFAIQAQDVKRFLQQIALRFHGSTKATSSESSSTSIKSKSSALTLNP